MESGRLLQLLWLPLRPPPEGVCVSMLRVLLLRCGGTGGGARCPSGTSCGCRKKPPHTHTHEWGQKNRGINPRTAHIRRLTTIGSSFSVESWMVMRSISWFRPSTLLRNRGADDFEMGMGISMVLGIGDYRKTGRRQQLVFMPHTRTRTEFQLLSRVFYSPIERLKKNWKHNDFRATFAITRECLLYLTRCMKSTATRGHRA